MRTKHILYVLLLGIIAVSCRRKNEEIVPAAAPVAGKGGNTQLRVITKHFERVIDTGTVYIRYNSAISQQDMRADDSSNIKFQNGNYMVVFDSLKRGNYYFFVKGRDFRYITPNDSLFGYGSFMVVDTILQTHNVNLSVRNFSNIYTP